jgi:hypothetical protein
MGSLAKRLLVAALAAAMFGTLPVRAAMDVPAPAPAPVKTKPRALDLEQCAWVCSSETPCDTACAREDGGEATCGDVQVCACEPIWKSSETIGRHCHDVSGSWQVAEHKRVTVEFGGCKDPQSSCDAELASGATYESEEDCCGAEGCWGDWC